LPSFQAPECLECHRHCLFLFIMVILLKVWLPSLCVLISLNYLSLFFPHPSTFPSFIAICFLFHNSFLPLRTTEQTYS
jgi:hypothetical protein